MLSFRWHPIRLEFCHLHSCHIIDHLPNKNVRQSHSNGRMEQRNEKKRMKKKKRKHYYDGLRGECVCVCVRCVVIVWSRTFQTILEILNKFHHTEMLQWVCRCAFWKCHCQWATVWEAMWNGSIFTVLTIFFYTFSISHSLCYMYICVQCICIGCFFL